MLFLIPVGGGIPGGVLLAKSRGLPWPSMMGLYFISDVILACLFEPLLKLIIRAGRVFPFLNKLSGEFKKILLQTSAKYGKSTGPLMLVYIAFSVDPMTGRAAAGAAGHGFLSGWLIAIMGDMIYFSVLMVSTLWLNQVLGDGTLTMLIIFALFFGIPILVRRLRKA